MIDISEIEVPRQVPVMTLPSAVLFPQVIMPLHIFEERYREMLSDSLASHRIFGIATLDENLAEDPNLPEPYSPYGSIGIIRASQGNEDGTSNVLLQGIIRVRFTGVVAETPYRILEIEPLETTTDEDAPYSDMKEKILQLLAQKRNLGSEVSEEILSFLHKLEDPETFSEFAAYACCENAEDKLLLVKETETAARYDLILSILQREVARAELFKNLQHGLDDDQIGLN